jgi:hypothetical protein
MENNKQIKLYSSVCMRKNKQINLYSPGCMENISKKCGVFSCVFRKLQTNEAVFSWVYGK